MKITDEERIKYVKEYLKDKKTAIEISEELGVHRSEIYKWINKYKSQGEKNFTTKPKKYTKETKQKAVNDYLNGKGSVETIANKYQLSSYTILSRWIKNHIDGKENKTYQPKKIYKLRLKARKLTIEEKLEIISYWKENKKDICLTAFTYDVTYSQVTYLVKKEGIYGESSVVNVKKGAIGNIVEIWDNENIEVDFCNSTNNFANIVMAVSIKDIEVKN